MSQTLSISYPRSGHHLLANFLIDYYARVNEKFIYCEYYGHCKTIPCIDANTDYQKTHDLDLSLPINTEQKYIIQYRHPIDSIISYYQLSAKNNWNIKNDNRINWNKFLTKKVKYWKLFMDKWVLQPDIPNCIKINYDDLVDSPYETTASIIKFIKPGSIINNDILNDIISLFSINGPRNSIESFKYYNKKKFSKIENNMSARLDKSGIPLKFK